MSIKELNNDIKMDVAALKSLVFGAVSEDIEGVYKNSFVNNLRSRLMSNGPFKDFSKTNEKDFLDDIDQS